MKDLKIGIRLSEEDKANITETAKSLNMTVSDYVLYCTKTNNIISLPELQEYVASQSVLAEQLHYIYGELLRSGKNINLIAKAVNARADYISKADYKEFSQLLDKHNKTALDLRDKEDELTKLLETITKTILKYFEASPQTQMQLETIKGKLNELIKEVELLQRR